MSEEEKLIVENENYIARTLIYSDDVVDLILASLTDDHNLFDEMYYAILKSFCLGYYRAKQNTN